MRGFKAQSTSYQFAANEAVLLVPLDEVRYPQRTVAHDFGGFGRKRLICVLSGIANGQELPPVEMETANGDGFRYGLRHGFHRYSASIAAGFTHIPAFVFKPWKCG